jgi:hypothetical protein
MPALVAAGVVVAMIRDRVERRSTYEEEILPHLGEFGFTLVSSVPLKRFSTGPFPKVHVFSQPYVRTTTPIGSGEFVKYRKLVLRNSSGDLFDCYVLIEFKAFRSSDIRFEPPLASRGSKS